MRDVLARYNDRRIAILGRVGRVGTHRKASGRTFPTVLLEAVTTPDGELLADHCWVYLTKTLRELALQHGDLLQCTARVRLYRKGYVGTEPFQKPPIATDYTLEHLQDCQRVHREEGSA